MNECPLVILSTYLRVLPHLEGFYSLFCLGICTLPCRRRKRSFEIFVRLGCLARDILRSSLISFCTGGTSLAPSSLPPFPTLRLFVLLPLFLVARSNIRLLQISWAYPLSRIFSSASQHAQVVLRLVYVFYH